LRSIRNPPKRVLAWLFIALLGGIATARAQAPTDQTSVGTLSPAQLAAQVTTIADATVSQWADHELKSGALADPVLGPVTGSYGVAMIGQAMVELGVSSNSPALIADGLQAERSEVSHPNGGSFELLSLAEAYAFNQEYLAHSPAWPKTRTRIGDFLRAHQRLFSEQGACFLAADCYDNLKLVAAVADLALLQTGLDSSQHGALLKQPKALHAEALAWLAMAAKNAGDGATRSGATTFADAGILSDPPENPLAYHALSAVMLGRAVLALGPRAPAKLRSAFWRAADALSGLMAPDGDVSYIGRGQGQVWSVGTSIDALTIAAELTNQPVWRGRYLAGVALALQQLEAVYPTSGWGLPLVPRLALSSEPETYRGVDPYANTVEYNGLTLWALQDAAARLQAIPPAPAESVPSQTNGVFVDPSHTRFVAVTHGNLWFAIHGTNSNPGDARYGFGLVAAELQTPSGWEPALPPRPLTRVPVTGGLVMFKDGGTFNPIGRRISATTGGVVTIQGRWSSGSATIGRDTLWTYSPSPTDGVTLSFEAPAHSAYQLEVWYDAGSQVRTSRHGISVVEPDGLTQSYALNTRVIVTKGKRYSSAYALNLQSELITVPSTSAARLLTYTTVVGTGGTGPSGVTGQSGATGSSGDTGATGGTG
jgi:hypothetical protein